MLQIANLLHRFGQRVAVDGVSLQVREGEIMGLVGRNGAGKTTTMRAIMGILHLAGGEVRWRGHVVDWSDRLRFGYMPEERGLYAQMRVLEQVTYFGQLHGLDSATARREAQACLNRLGLGGREADRVLALSHGNQQRVQLAIALVYRPELMVLDEPFAGLDPAAVDVLAGIIRAEASRGATILFSSHQMELVSEICNRIVILEAGKVLASGTLKELRDRFPQRLRVKVEGSDDWAAHLDGTRVVGQDANGVLLIVEPGTDPQAILRVAQAAGRVEHFGFESRGLIDLYRELVPA